MAMCYVGAAWAKIGRRDKAEEVLRELGQLSTQRYVGSMAFALETQNRNVRGAGLETDGRD
jgi:hypothetical protein